MVRGVHVHRDVNKADVAKHWVCSQCWLGIRSGTGIIVKEGNSTGCVHKHCWPRYRRKMERD